MARNNISDLVNGRVEENVTEVSSAVRYDRVQIRSDEEKALARQNCGAIGQSELSSAKGDITKVMNMIAPEYDAESTYAAGDLVTHSKKLYACVADIETAEAWTAAHWEETTLAEVLAAL